MSYKVDKLDPERKYGVVITGLKEEDLNEETTRAQLRELWIEHGLVNFKVEATPSFHVSLSKVFGELEPHPVKEYQHKDDPNLLAVIFDPEKTDIWEVDGKRLGAWLPWHFDLCYMPHTNHGGILRPVTRPSTGGETAFIDMIEAYERLPLDIRDRIEGKYVVYRMRIDPREHTYVGGKHDIKLIRTHPRIEDVRVRQDHDYPPVVHPIVYTQPETGRKVLNLSPSMAESIHGMEKEESHELLDYLVDHVTDEHYAYVHKWEMDDMLLWDNWRVNHKACGMEPGEYREMLRTTIKGDYNLGMYLSEFEQKLKLEQTA